LNFRYLFRYLLLGFPNALGSQKGQKRAAKHPQKPESATKIQEYFYHVAVDANINSVVVNNAGNPCKIMLYEGFYNSTF